MLVGLVVIFEAVRTKSFTELKFVEKFLKEKLSNLFTRANRTHPLLFLYLVIVYLLLSRCGPVLTRIGEATFDLNQKLDPVGVQSLQNVYVKFRGVTRVPGPFSRRYKDY